MAPAASKSRRRTRRCRRSSRKQFSSRSTSTATSERGARRARGRGLIEPNPQWGGGLLLPSDGPLEGSRRDRSKRLYFIRERERERERSTVATAQTGWFTLAVEYFSIPSVLTVFLRGHRSGCYVGQKRPRPVRRVLGPVGKRANVSSVRVRDPRSPTVVLSTFRRLHWPSQSPRRGDRQEWNAARCPRTYVQHSVAIDLTISSQVHVLVPLVFCVVLCRRETAQKYAVQSMPTFLMLKNGKQVDELKGAGEDALRQAISRNV